MRLSRLYGADADFSICTYNCRSLSGNKVIDHLLQEVEEHRTTSAVCATHTEGWRSMGMEVWFSRTQERDRKVWAELVYR